MVLQNNYCSGCLFFDKCGDDYACDDFYYEDEDAIYAEAASELHSEYFGDYQRYLKEFYE